MLKKRYFYLDVLKTVAIFLVCLYHFYIGGTINYNNNLSVTNFIERFLFNICSCCVPLFFMVNGALILNKKLNIKRHLKKCIKILIQCWIWKCIVIVICASFYKINLLKYSPYALFNTIFLADSLDGFDFSAFWFIYVLLCVYFLLPFVKKCLIYLLKIKNTNYI